MALESVEVSTGGFVSNAEFGVQIGQPEGRNFQASAAARGWHARIELIAFREDCEGNTQSLQHEEWSTDVSVRSPLLAGG